MPGRVFVADPLPSVEVRVSPREELPIYIYPPLFAFLTLVLIYDIFEYSTALFTLYTFLVTFLGCVVTRIAASIQAKKQIQDTSYQAFQPNNSNLFGNYFVEIMISAFLYSIIVTLIAIPYEDIAVFASPLVIAVLSGRNPCRSELEAFDDRVREAVRAQRKLQNQVSAISQISTVRNGPLFELSKYHTKTFYSLSNLEQAIPPREDEIRQFTQLAVVYREITTLYFLPLGNKNKSAQEVITAIEQFEPGNNQISAADLRSAAEKVVMSLLIAEVVEEQRFQLQQRVVEQHEKASYVDETDLVESFLRELSQSQLNERALIKLESDAHRIISKILKSNEIRKPRIRRTQAKIRRVRDIQRVEELKRELQNSVSTTDAAPEVDATHLHNCIEYADSSQLALAHTRLDRCIDMLQLLKWTGTLVEEHGINLSASETVIRINELLREQDGTYSLFHSDIDQLKNLRQKSNRLLEFLTENSNTTPYVDSKINKTIVVEAIENADPERLQPAVEFIEESSGYVWSINDLYEPSWEKFEHLVGYLYRDKGYDVTVTRSSTDFGVDVWATRDGERVAIQVKQFAQGNTIGREVIQKISSYLVSADADKVVVVTSSSFATTAVDYATRFGNNIELIDGEELRIQLSESSLTPEQIDRIY